MPQSKVSVEDTHGVTPLHLAASSHIARLQVAAGGGGCGAAGAFNARGTPSGRATLRRALPPPPPLSGPAAGSDDRQSRRRRQRRRPRYSWNRHSRLTLPSPRTSGPLLPARRQGGRRGGRQQRCMDSRPRSRP